MLKLGARKAKRWGAPAMTDVPAEEGEGRPVIRLRDAIAFYDSLPENTRKRFRAATDVSDLHFGFGMFLRNAILWKNDIKVLAVELKVVREEVGKGRSTLTYTHVSDAADRL